METILIRDQIIEMIKAAAAYGKYDQYELHMQPDTESELAQEVSARRDIYGDTLSAKVLVDGVRAVFYKFLGFDVVYGSNKFELVAK